MNKALGSLSRLKFNFLFSPNIIKPYREGRICSRCGVKLTIYNPNKMCFVCMRKTTFEELEKNRKKK